MNSQVPTAYDQDALEAIAAEVGALLLTNGQRLATAESCTGGWVAQCLTAIAGSSDWFERGFVTYSNAAKQEMLGVPPELIAVHGAVSEAVAVAMATGALRHSRADRAVAITGVAGPSGGRREIRAQSVARALSGLLDLAAPLSA